MTGASVPAAGQGFAEGGAEGGHGDSGLFEMNNGGFSWPRGYPLVILHFFAGFPHTKTLQRSRDTPIFFGKHPI